MPKAPKDRYRRLRPFLPIFRKYFAPELTLLLKKAEVQALDKLLHEHRKAHVSVFSLSSSLFLFYMYILFLQSKAFFRGKPDCYSNAFFASMNYLASHVSLILSKSKHKPYRWEKSPPLSLASVRMSLSGQVLLC